MKTWPPPKGMLSGCAGMLRERDQSNLRPAVTWEDAYYNLVRPHKSLRLRNPVGSQSKWMPRTPAVVAKVTDHIWNVKKLLLTVPLPKAKNTC
jgi:hypothetical protein